MWKLVRKACCIFAALALLQSCVTANDKMVHVTLFSDNKSIESTIHIEKGMDGQKYIRISLTNTGKEIDRIDSIEVEIEPEVSVNKNAQLMYGGTCMGRTPIKQSTISDTKSKSGTFLMIKHNEKSYSNIGVLSWNTFMPYIHYIKNRFVISADGENKPIKPGERIEFEKIILSNGESWQDLMFKYGTEIAKEHSIQLKEPVNLKGWSTWDYYGRVYDTKDVYKNIDKLKSVQVANIIQIDGGWWTARGDYLSVRKNLQGGMKAIADYAKSKGYKAGIHLDGFRGDKDSELFKNHPDWFLKDQDGEVICQSIDKGDTFMQYIYYDYSNPQVCEYMKNVLRTIKNDWGFSYFKIDFMRYGLHESIMAEHGNNCGLGKKVVTKVNSFNNSMTSVERTRAGLLAMRDGIGDAYFLGCSAIFGPTFGIVDGLRTGADICPTFNYYEACSLQNMGNFYLNQTVVQVDADYLVVRNKDDEEPERAWGENKFGGNTTFDEAKMWSDYVGLYGGPKISSDNLLTLRPERKKLIDNAFAYKTAKRFIPLDMWNHAKDKKDAFNVMLAENEDGVYISLFNWGETEKNFNIDGFLNEKIIEPITKKSIIIKNGKFVTTLKSHSSIILKVENSSFDKLRNKLQLN
ncbi:MAG: glycoside hydrolase family 36 protein [Bacteroidota bacterium]